MKYVHQGWHRLVNYLNEEGFLVGFPKIISALKSASDSLKGLEKSLTFEPWHEISNNLVCATSKGSDQSAHTRSLVRVFTSRLNIL